jgi:hypothetical protein
MNCRLFCILAALIALAGCASDAPPPPSPIASATTRNVLEPVAQEIVRRVPPLRSQRFSMLLDFEDDSDAVFIGSRPQGRIVYDRAHTGRRSVKFSAPSTRFIFKLGSVLSGRPFPADWTLIGPYIYSEQPVELTVSLQGTGLSVPPRTMSLAANTWTSALLDISSLARSAGVGAGEGSVASAPSNAMLVLTLKQHHSPVWVDDLLLIDNTEVLVSNERPKDVTPTPTTAPLAIASTQPTTASTSPEPVSSDVAPEWSVSRRGLSYIGQMPGRFNFQLLTSEASKSGWKIQEANALRARFTSEGKDRALTVYADGRSYWDGQLRPMSAQARDNAAFAEEHASPGEVVLAPELGRVNRDTPGDANNDGYNEQRGAYQLIATGARLELKLIPHTRWLESPVLEVTGLPPGGVLVTVEGRLVENSVRLSDGSLLVELPVRFDRPTTINLRIQ